MRSEGPGELHLQVGKVSTAGSAVLPGATPMQAKNPTASRLSLLRLSLSARLLIVASVSVLLWGAVFWALR
jgi:hypothetical protein